MAGNDGAGGGTRKSADNLKAQNSPRLPISVAAAEAGYNTAFETSCTDYARLNAGRCASARLDSFKPRPKTPEVHGRGGQRGDTRTGPQLLNREALDVFEMGIARHLANHRNEVQDELREAREALVVDVSKLLADTRGIRMLETLDNKVNKIISGPVVIDLAPAVDRTERAEQKLEQHIHEFSVAMLKAFRESSESLRKDMLEWEQRQEKVAEERFREIMASLEAKGAEEVALTNCSIDLVSKLHRSMDASFEEVRQMHREDQDFQAHAREERLRLQESSEKLHNFVETVAGAVEILRQNQEDIKSSSANALEEFRIGREEARMYRSEIFPRMQAELTNQFELHAPKVDLKPLMRQMKVTQHMLGFNFPQLLGEVGRVQQALNVDFVPAVDLRLFGFPSLIGELREVAGEKPMPVLPYPSSSPLVITSSSYSGGNNSGAFRASRATRSLSTTSSLRPRRSARIASNIESPTSQRSRQSTRSNLSDAEEQASNQGELSLTKSMPVLGGLSGERRHSARPALGLKGRAFSLFGNKQASAAAAAAAAASSSSSVIPLGPTASAGSSTRDSVSSAMMMPTVPGMNSGSPVTQEDPPEIPLQDAPITSSGGVSGGIMAAARAATRAASTVSGGRGRRSSAIAALFASNNSSASAASAGSGDAAAMGTASRETRDTQDSSRQSSKNSSLNNSDTSSSTSDKMCASNGEPAPPPPPKTHHSLGSITALFSTATNAALAAERHSISSATLVPPSGDEVHATRSNDKRLSSTSSNAGGGGGGGSNRGSVLSVTFNIAKQKRHSSSSSGESGGPSENSEDVEQRDDADDDDEGEDAEDGDEQGRPRLRRHGAGGSSSSSLASSNRSWSSRNRPESAAGPSEGTEPHSGKLRTQKKVMHRASQPAVPTSEIPIVLRRQTSADMSNPHMLLHPQWAVQRLNRGPSDGSPPRTVTPPALLVDYPQQHQQQHHQHQHQHQHQQQLQQQQQAGGLQPPTLPIRSSIRSNSVSSSNGSPDGEEPRFVMAQTTVQLRDFSSTAFDYLGQHGSESVQEPASQRLADNIPGQVELEEALWADDGALAGKQGSSATAQIADAGASTVSGEGAESSSQAAAKSPGTTEASQAEGTEQDVRATMSGGDGATTTSSAAAAAAAAAAATMTTTTTRATSKDDSAPIEGGGGGGGVDKGTGPDQELPPRSDSPRKSMTYLQPPDGSRPKPTEEVYRSNPPYSVRNALLPDTAVVRRRHYWTQTDTRWANASCQTDETGARNLVAQKEVKKANPTLMLDAPKKKEVKSFKNVLLDQDAMKQKAMAKMSRPQYNVQNFYHDKGWAQRVARSAAFEYATLIVIALNALWIAIDIDYNDAQYLVEAHPIFQVGENLFCCYFTGEVLVRFCAFKRKACAAKDFWFVFDSLLVLLMILETWVLTLVIMLSGSDVSAGLGGMSMLRIFRLVKLARVSRVARLLRSVPELLILVKGLKAASRSVVVFFIMWSLMIYIYALFLRMVDVFDEQLLFATIPQTMNMLLLRGILPMHADFIFSSSSDNYLYWPILVSFIILAFVMLMNMLVGVSVEVITAVASTEREGITVLELATHLRETLTELGFETEGYFTKDMISSFIEQPSIHGIVDRVGADLVAVFDLCTQQFEERDMEGIKFEELVEMIMSLRGTNNAKVKDVKALLRSMRSTMREVEHNLRVVLYEELNEIRQQMYDTMKAQAAMMQDRDRDSDDGSLVRKDTLWSQ